MKTLFGDKRPVTIIAVPTAENGYAYVAQGEAPGEFYIMKGMGAPIRTSVGDKGFVQYIATSSYGLYCWVKE